MTNTDRLLRRPEVCRITGMTRYLIDLLEQNGSFPKRMLVGRRNVYWSEAEVLDFLSQTKNKRSSAPSNNETAMGTQHGQ
jgi:predicted DNA-binding transcriptional regulator AlpA